MSEIIILLYLIEKAFREAWRAKKEIRRIGSREALRAE